jgi:hypothetical protein
MNEGLRIAAEWVSARKAGEHAKGRETVERLLRRICPNQRPVIIAEAMYDVCRLIGWAEAGASGSACDFVNDVDCACSAARVEGW